MRTHLFFQTDEEVVSFPLNKSFISKKKIWSCFVAEVKHNVFRIKRFTLTNILSDKARADAQNDSFVTFIQRQIDTNLCERKLTTQTKKKSLQVFQQLIVKHIAAGKTEPLML